MKKIVLITLVLWGTTLTAQEERPGHRREMHKELTAEQRATLQTKRLTLALDLSESQQEKVYALTLENAERHKIRREERAQRRESNEAERPSAEERYEREIDRLDGRIAHKAAMKEILSEAQYEKFERLHRGTRHAHREGKMARRARG